MRNWKHSAIRISIHALREEGDLTSLWMDAGSSLFLSTPSARRATFPFCGHLPIFVISIHALREEGDLRIDVADGLAHLRFLSTPSARRATRLAPGIELVLGISIHALREEGDGRGPAEPCRPGYFYPRPPRGGRQ